MNAGKDLYSRGFTHVDPFEDTESQHKFFGRAENVGCFTHVDPFEDTESPWPAARRRSRPQSFTHVDPFEDTESVGAVWGQAPLVGFTHVDPFEDTESFCQ